jgi:hypothetical protein
MPAGQSAFVVESKIAGSATEAGLAVIRQAAHPERGVVAPDATAAELAADVDALLESETALGDSSGTVWDQGDFDGALAGKAFDPPRQVSLTLANEGDWDATTAVVVGTAPGGAYLSDTIAIPDGGNDTVSTAAFFETVESVTIPAQTGDAVGSIGVAAVSQLADADCWFVLRDEAKTMSFVGADADEQDAFAEDDAVAALKRGRMIVYSETAAAAGDPVYVRKTAGAEERLGAVRPTPDSTDCIRARGWYFRTDSSGSNNAAEIERR